MTSNILNSLNKEQHKTWEHEQVKIIQTSILSIVSRVEIIVNAVIKDISADQDPSKLPQVLPTFLKNENNSSALKQSKEYHQCQFNKYPKMKKIFDNWFSGSKEDIMSDFDLYLRDYPVPLFLQALYQTENPNHVDQLLEYCVGEAMAEADDQLYKCIEKIINFK